LELTDMQDRFTSVATDAVAARERAVNRDQVRAKKNARVAEIGEDIAFLQREVSPELDAAKATLVDAGVALTIEDMWTIPGEKPQASIALLVRPGAGWPHRVEHSRGCLVRISCASGVLSVHQIQGRSATGTATEVPLDGADPVFSAIAYAVSTFLAAAEAAS
jgi:hypothetical protein